MRWKGAWWADIGAAVMVDGGAASRFDGLVMKREEWTADRWSVKTGLHYHIRSFHDASRSYPNCCLKMRYDGVLWVRLERKCKCRSSEARPAVTSSRTGNNSGDLDSVSALDVLQPSHQRCCSTTSSEAWKTENEQFQNDSIQHEASPA